MVKFRQKSKEGQLKLRYEILSHYSNGTPICKCCGENEFKFLSIDHVFNDGAEERKRIGNNVQLLYWIKRNNFPPDRYQVLCYNCNLAKGFYGSCPHKNNA